MSGFSNIPKILKGAFVEYGISSPPLIVPFQFNPITISRDRSNTFSVPGGKGADESALRKDHQREEFDDLIKLRDKQDVNVGPETISFDIRLDATDKLEEGDPIAQQFGIAPQLSTLELMMYPRVGGPGETAIPELRGGKRGYTFTGKEKPPMILFVWGEKKVLPVNLTSMNIKEEEFDPNLNPIRATVTVSLTVIEGPNAPYLFSIEKKETMSRRYSANVPQPATAFIPK